MIKIHESTYSQGIRENLRLKHLVAAGLFSLIVCSTIYLTAYLEGSEGRWTQDPVTKNWEKGDGLPVNGARNAFTFLLALQGFYLMFLGTGRVASITAEERESGLLDYQRMTPMNPFSKNHRLYFWHPRSRILHVFLYSPFPWARNPRGKIATGKHHSIVFCFLLFRHPLPPHCTCSGFNRAQASGGLLGFPHSRSWFVCGTAWSWTGGNILSFFPHHSPYLLR